MRALPALAELLDALVYHTSRLRDAVCDAVERREWPETPASHLTSPVEPAKDGAVGNELATESAAFVRAAMKHARITQAELAVKLGVSSATTCNWCNGKRNISIRTMKRIAKACGMELALTVNGRAA